MIDALARLAPLAIELMNQRAYAHGGYAHGGHHAHHYADGGGMDGQQPQHNQTAPMPQEGSPYGGSTAYVQQEPSLNAPQGAPMAPYAHGGYAHGGHPHHYMHGGEGHYMSGGYHHGGAHPGYAHDGGAPAAHHSGHHMPHYAFGGQFKGAYQAANGMRPATHPRPTMGQRAPMGHRPMPMGAGPHQQRPMQSQNQMPQPPQAIETEPQEQEMQGARHGGHMPHKDHGGPLYPYHR